MTGYKGVPTSDPKEAALRAKWYEAKAAVERGEEFAEGTFAKINDELASYVWQRTINMVEADRKKHPKAKRNRGFDGPKGSGRALL